MFSLFLDANFVSSFEYKDNFVYFFLREKAIEKGKVGMHFKITNYQVNSVVFLVKRFGM